MQPVEIRADRRKVLSPLLGSAAFVALAAWAISTGDPVNVVVGVVGVVFFGFGVVLFGRQLASPVLLRIDGEGYHDRSSFATPGRILWSDVGTVSIDHVGSQRFLAIALADPELVMRRAGPLRRLVMRANKEAGFEPVSIAESTLPFPLETLIDAMRRCNADLTVLP
jgi:hypothetical protein